MNCNALFFAPPTFLAFAFPGARFSSPARSLLQHSPFLVSPVPTFTRSKSSLLKGRLYRVGYAIASFTTGSSTLGETFNPAQDCPDIVDQIPGAEDGFYWINFPNGKKHKVGFGHNIEQ